MTATMLVPLPVVLPLVLGAVLLALGHVVPSRTPDIVATAGALAVAAVCAVLVVASRDGTLVYWFGDWTPRPDVVLGIGFGVDPISAGVAGFVALLFAATFVFAWGYFAEVKASFQVVMLLFLAGMEGFCLTRDLFNMFVWFEVMAVAAYALTAYALDTAPLAGALTFTVVNSIASFAMLGGIGLLYGRLGSLDFAALGHAVATGPTGDPVVAGALCLLALALLTKGALAPLHFWLADAHAVAPSPVSVIFSGAMVPLGLFGFAKITHQVFDQAEATAALLRNGLTTLGALTAVIGAAMAWRQRHVKRLLAFSTISHMGIMVIGIAALSTTGLAGVLAYLFGHGLVKGTLFMLAGVLLAEKASIDELDLRGLGRDIWPAGVATLVAGLLLAGLPFGVLHGGDHLIEGAVGVSRVETAAIVFGMAVTGAAVLRATGRIYLGLGPDPGDEAEAPSAEEQEKANRPLWLMLAPCVLLLILAILPSDGVISGILRHTAQFTGMDRDGAPPSPASGAGLLPWLSVSAAVLLACWALFRDHLPRRWVRTTDAMSRPLLAGLDAAHSGLVGDYVAWLVVGLALFTAATAFG